MFFQRVDGVVCIVAGNRLCYTEYMLVGEACDCMVWNLGRCNSLSEMGM